MCLFYFIPRWSSLLICFLVVLVASGFLNVLLVFDAMRFFKWKEARSSKSCRQRVNPVSTSCPLTGGCKTNARLNLSCLKGECGPGTASYCVI
jgi:hypothetical protein